MAISIDSFANSGGANATYTHTIGSAPIVYLAQTYGYNNTNNSTTPKFGGANMTLAYSFHDTTNGYNIELWYLKNPSTGANTVTITNNIQNQYAGVSFALNGSNVEVTSGSTAENPTQNTAAHKVDINTNITPSFNNSLILSLEMAEGTPPSADTLTEESGQTAIDRSSGSIVDLNVAQLQLSGSPTTNIGFDYTNAGPMHINSVGLLLVEVIGQSEANLNATIMEY